MFTSCVQTVLHLQPHTLEVSFATLQLLYQLRAGEACPIPQQFSDFQRIFKS